MTAVFIGLLEGLQVCAVNLLRSAVYSIGLAQTFQAGLLSRSVT